MRYCLPESKAVNQQLVKEQSREGRAVTDKVILRQLCASREEGNSWFQPADVWGTEQLKTFGDTR